VMRRKKNSAGHHIYIQALRPCWDRIGEVKYSGRTQRELALEFGACGLLIG
jgi:hypothetical protein